MKFAKKWRETIIDPLNTIFPCGLIVKKVNGYPHAANDVFSVVIEENGQQVDAILKYERHIDSNLSKEIEILGLLNCSNIHYKIPQVISFGMINNKNYIVTKFEDGKRISQLINHLEADEITNESIKYMKKFGENLGKIHSTKVIFEKTSPRKFTEIMNSDMAKKIGIEKVRDWLIENKPIVNNICFVHGDHHYANVIWKCHEIICTLDWELSGMGWKEFDIAWALINRPSQKFMKTQSEIEYFLEGYSQHQEYDKKVVDYCMILIYQYFYEMGMQMKDNEYCDYVKKQFDKL